MQYDGKQHYYVRITGVLGLCPLSCCSKKPDISEADLFRAQEASTLIGLSEIANPSHCF
jgi:methylphosphotriester-DNA--protein-cysteine methyltransferase